MIKKKAASRIRLQLFYAGDGNLLQKRDVSGNKDDTHWPIDELKTGR